MAKSLQRLSLAGSIIALGIVFGDIGTSPLYVMSAIVRNKAITEELILGALSCVFWTLTLITTLKYVILILRADNKGEGGVLSLYALIRRHSKRIVWLAMAGAAALLADGFITPAITVTSAVEGMDLGRTATLEIVLLIIAGVFFLQQFGTSFIGRYFGPIMALWFLSMAAWGSIELVQHATILKAINPMYAINLLWSYPEGFWILGAVFLCTTGAESIYSDLGHCGKKNIRMAWMLVKVCLLLNYFGQGAWLLQHYKGKKLPAGINPFFEIIPEGLRGAGVLLATVAAVIACQALISGSFTLINEAIRLNLWPKLKINFPSSEKGQLYIPAINIMLWLGSSMIVLHFQEAAAMEGAYGLAITFTMIVTTLLYTVYLYVKRKTKGLLWVFLLVFLTIELSYLVANLQKFQHGGQVAFMISLLMFAIMAVWHLARKIKNAYMEFVRLDEYVPMLQDLSNDRTIPKFASHLVYLTSANHIQEIEHKILYSIFHKRPKRADIYWFVHVDVVDDPHTLEYKVTTIIPNEIIRIDFRLGFRVEHKIHLFFRKVVEELVANREVNIMSQYESLNKNNVRGDFRFIVMEKYLSHDNELPFFKKIIMNAYFFLKKFSLSEEKAFGLEQSDVIVEKIPLVVTEVKNIPLKRVGEKF